jgi:hypothetical protein
MMKPIQIFVFCASLGLLIIILELVRRGKLKERFALLWLFSAAVLIVFSIWGSLLEILARILGIYYAPSVLLPVVIFFAVILFIYFSVIVSRQSEQLKNLAQKIALLEEELRKKTSD